MTSFDDEFVSSKEGLLEREPFSSNLKDEQWNSKSSPGKGLLSRIWQHRTSFLIHIIIFTAYAISFSLLLNLIAKRDEHGPNLVNSPAQEAVRFEKKFINNDVNRTSPFKGKPRPELDDAWDSLFVYNNIRVTKQELDRMNRTSVPLADGSGDYLAALDVYHHLHCLKLIRHYIHPEYYQMQPSLMVDPAEHIDHCLDAIRQELQCRAEVSLTTYEWLPDLPIPWAQLSYDHTCVNFDAINQWAKSRSIGDYEPLVLPCEFLTVVDIFDPKYLSHPTKGPPFGNGAGHVHKF